ncbi:ABC transporter ATP-binding protein, partial [candidate division KSB3 bacterium]
MGHIAISVEHLGKCYRIGQADKRPENLREAVRSFLASPFYYLRSRFREPSPDEILWALKDVSFEVKHGEVLGIIGRNGAGKSTLLKILSRITEPTEGVAKVYGRIGSLLEVGTGFHPELTGRENIYLNGTILGMKRAEIDAQFDEIVDFSGIEKFLDTPVKRYSSGMYVRLAFAVAAHLNPEILLVDEVLAVGDAEFQKKCLGKMEDVAKEGQTVLFISHNMVAVQKLCERSLWLQDGTLLKQGESHYVVSEYLDHSFSNASEQVWDRPDTAPGNNKVRVHRVSVHSEQGGADEPITMQTPVVVEIEFWNFIPDTYIDVTLHFFTEQGILAFGTSTVKGTQWYRRPFPMGLFYSACHVPGNLLNSGIYRITLIINQNEVSHLYYHENILAFRVADSLEVRGAWHGKLAGAVRPKL